MRGNQLSSMNIEKKLTIQ